MILFIRNKAKICLVSLVLLALTSVVSGCGGADSSVEVTSAGSESTQTVADATASSTPKSTKTQTTKSATPTATKSSADSAAKTTPTAVQKTVPKLTDVSFTLTLDEGQKYTEYTTPIYLEATQKLHLNWLVVKGDHFYLSFSLPSGSAITVRSNGSLGPYSPETIINEKLTKNGDLVLSPSTNDWTDGYYIFHSQLLKGDSPATVKLLYWIE
jgi:hypothetical protein